MCERYCWIFAGGHGQGSEEQPAGKYALSIVLAQEVGCVNQLSLADRVVGKAWLRKLRYQADVF